MENDIVETEREVDLNEEIKARSHAMKAAKRSAITLSISAVVAALGLGRVLYSFDLSAVVMEQIVGFSALLMGFGVAALSYLRPRGAIVAEDDLSGKYLNKRLEKMASEVFERKVGQQILTDDERRVLMSKLEANLANDAMKEYLAKFNAPSSGRAKTYAINRHFHGMALRLSEEVENQARRGNVNLVLGIMMTTVGMGIFGASVYYSPASGMEQVTAYFAPRLTLVIFIQVFSYFFLRLYKQSLSEIKYFQNEITNLESKQLAILIAQNTETPGAYERIVKNLMKTERNFLMNKDQTTIELERDRIDQSKVSELLQTVKDFAKGKSGGA